DSDDRHAESVQVGDHRFQQPAQLTVKSSAKDRVDDQFAARDLAEVKLPFLRVGQLDDGQADSSEHLEVGSRVAAHIGDAAEQKYGYLDAPLDERSRDNKSVAAIVAPPAHHPDMHGREI